MAASDLGDVHGGARLTSHTLVEVTLIIVAFICLELNAITNKKVKFSRTRYRALGPELIPVYRQSARS